MVDIHGGFFAINSGNGEFLGPDFLIECNVILVTLNYRLGVFGFMSLGTPEYSGNMALKDQQLALKWVHSNIQHFSGDNRRITLFGESSGAAMAHLHTFSSESRKYFQNLIAMSGAVDNFWALASKDNHLSMAHKMAEDLGEPNDSFKELVEFLKMAPASKMTRMPEGLLLRRNQVDLAPIVEGMRTI